MREGWGLLRSWWCEYIDDDDYDEDYDDDGMHIMMLTNIQAFSVYIEHVRDLTGSVQSPSLGDLGYRQRAERVSCFCEPLKVVLCRRD